MSWTDEDLKSRFILVNDENSDVCLYKISKEWWSRLYEYPWAGKFAEKEDVCLDAACGTGHHFKFYLAHNCSEVYACDLDTGILNRDAMINGIGTGFGEEAKNLVEKVYDKIRFSVNDISKLPYEDKKFHKVYCISVLEHLPYDVMEGAFKEFNRVLRDDGLVIVTFDYPSINLDLFKQAITASNLTFVGQVDFNMPGDALNSYIYPGLYCFRAVLKKI